MAKQKATIYEEMVFDDVQYAVSVYNECKRKREKIKKAMIIALIATVCNLYGSTVTVLIDNADVTALQEAVGAIGIILAIVAYVMGGGILTALKWAGKIAKFVWIVVVFPLDLILGVGALMVAFVCFFCVPILFVFMNYKQVDADFKAASRYISCFKKAQVSQPPVRVSANNVYSNVSSTRQAVDERYVNASRTQNNANRNYATSTRTQQSDNRSYSSNARVQSGGNNTYTSSSGRTYRVVTLPDGSKAYR